jgi:hypothetical protein
MVYAWYIQSKPNEFPKVLTVCDLYYDKAFPFVYALLENKSKETYTTVLHLTKPRNRELRQTLLDVVKSCVILNRQQMYSDAYFQMHLRDCAFFSLDRVFSGKFLIVLQSGKS